MATSSRFSIMRPSSRRFAECVMLQCRSTRHLTGHVFLIEFIYHVQWIQSYESHSYIHTSMTSILSHVHTQHIHTQYQFIHVCISRPEYRFQSCPSSSGFTYHCVKPQASTNERLAFIFYLVFKLPVLHNGPLEFIFLSCFKLPVLNNGPLEFTFYLVPSRQS